jgi:Predicted membrane protein (DUF2232).
MIETSAGVHLSEFEPRSGGLVARSTVLHALAAAFMCVSPLVVFVPAAYVNSGLKNGVKGAVGALAGSIAILVALAAASSTPRAFAGHLGEITGLVLALGVPSIVATVMIRRSASFGSVLFTVVMTSVLGLLLTELLLRMTLGVSPHQMMLENFRAQSAATVEVYRKLGTSEQVLRDMMGLSQKFAADYMVLFLECLVATVFGLSLTMIARLPAGRVTGSTYLLRNLAFPDVLLFGFVIGGLAPLASGVVRVVGLNILGIVVFLYFLQGLAVFRSLMIRLAVGLAGMLLAVVVIALFVPLSIVALALVGLFDPFFDFRKLNRKDDSDESHTD